MATRDVRRNVLMVGKAGPGPRDDVEVVVTAAEAPTELVFPLPSLRRNSLARLISDTYALVSSFFIAALTARLLGPSGKGFYASLVLLSGILVNCFSAGLGDAAIVMLGRRRAEMRDAAPATAGASLLLGALGAAFMFAASHLLLHPGSPTENLAVVFACVLVMFHLPCLSMVAFLSSLERMVAVAAVFVTYSTVSMVGVWSLLSLTDLRTAGAVLGTVAGNAAMLTAILLLLHRAAVPLRPRWRPGYLREALRFGMPLQLSSLLVLVTGRVDLLFVYRIADSAAAGRYSVALTIGMLVGTLPLALAYASFPRLANLDEEAAHVLTGQVFRIGMVVAVAGAVMLAAATPIVVPVFFGSAYRGAVGPSLLLVAGGVLWSGQWLLSRALAARGAAAALCTSFATSVVVMVSLDLVLIAPHGEMGAAAAAFASAVAGVAVAAMFYRGKGWDRRDFVPGKADVASLLRTASGFLRRLRPPTDRSASVKV